MLYEPIYLFIKLHDYWIKKTRGFQEPVSLYRFSLVWFMVFNATFNNNSVISWWSVLLVEETRVLWENHWPVASHWQTLSHNVVHLALMEIQIHYLIYILTRYDYNLTIMKSPKPATDNRLKK